MSIDETNVPFYIYVALVNADAVNYRIMSEDHVQHDHAIGLNDNNDDELRFYDAQNANETQKDNVNVADIATLNENDNDNNDQNNSPVIINNNNNNIQNNYVVVVNDTPNDSNNNEHNHEVIQNDIDDNINDNCEECVEVMVVTDGSVITDPSHSTKKKTKINNNISSPASNLRSKSLPAKRQIIPVKLNYVSTQSTINNSNKRKIATSMNTPASKKSSSTISSPSKKNTTSYFHYSCYSDYIKTTSSNKRKRI